jgi:hypothetical protein
VSPGKSGWHWKTTCLLFSIIFLSLIYFYEGGGWNQNSRFDLLRAIVERHTLTIDAYHENTHDKAHFNGHYYSDKAPGLVFLALPFAYGARAAMRVAGVDPESARAEFSISYVVTVCAVALPTALAGLCLFFLGLRFGAGSTEAAFGALAMCLGTPIWAYAGLFWAHALVGACLVFGLAAALKISTPFRSIDRKWQFPPSRKVRERGGAINVANSVVQSTAETGHPTEAAWADFAYALAVGLAAGWATLTEYPAGPAAAMLAWLALSRAWVRGWAARWRVAAGMALGAGICLAVLLAYLYAAFGSFRPSYAYYDPNSFAFMRRQGYMGLTYPHPDRLLKVLFGCSRGLFFASPVLLAAPFGLWALWEEREHRTIAVVATGIFAYYFLFNASFYWWKAGLSFGPRYAGASIPLLSIGLAVAWQRGKPARRRVLAVLAVASVFATVMVVSTTSQLAMQDSCPIVHTSWPAFWAGGLALNRESMLTTAEAARGNYGAFNLGQLIGLRGLASLTPLLLLWGISAVVWMRISRDRGSE